ncbi:MAG: zinc-ribbon domain-containing protein [Actinobacteria bacterium]|nr:zinc-ribbon domain-containing protein [Actinomycetota bacterium]
MRCPSCRSSNEDGANFCTRCGTAMSDVGATTQLDRDALGELAGAGDDEDDEDDDPTDPGGGEDEFAAIRRSGDDLRRCPACGAANSPRRMLCGRCGADLETGEPATRAPREAFSAALGPAGERSMGLNRTVLAIVTAGVLIGGGLGAMVALGVGPFAGGGEGPPPAVFDDARYAGPPDDLDPPAVGASTTHEPVADRVFDPQLMLDGDVTTAWNNAGQDAPSGVGEELRVEFSEPVWLTGIVLANGDQRDDDRYLGNARVQRARVILDAGVSFTVTFLDEQGRQAVRLDVPELTTGLRIEILETYPGDTYDDLAISELGFRGYIADAEDAEVARERARFPRVVRTEE